MTDFCAGTLPIDVHTLEKTVDSSHELFHLHKRDADPLAPLAKISPLAYGLHNLQQHARVFPGERGGTAQIHLNSCKWQPPTLEDPNKLDKKREFSQQWILMGNQ